MTNSFRIAVILLLKKSANLFASSIVEDAVGYCFSGFRCRLCRSRLCAFSSRRQAE